ncbi:MAG: hypothetical protein ABIJ16_11775 [Bacteroidota bacterium]
MNRIVTILLLCLALSAASQKMETGIVYAPLMADRLTFDSDYIVFSDYTSLTAGDGKIHPYITLLSTGVYFRYRLRNLYFQTELDFYENKFKKAIPDWATSREKYFTYSALEVPVLTGYTINPGSIYKIRLFAGINNRIGRFRTVFFSTLNYTINDNMYHEYYYADATRKEELIEKFSNYYIDGIAGIGFSYYNIGVEIRAEKNLTDMNRSRDDYNADYEDLVMFRACISIGFFKPWRTLGYTGKQ